LDNQLDVVRRYHVRTKHHFHAYARGPGYLNWDTQPDPFRRYVGARVLPLDREPPGELPFYESAFLRGGVAPEPLNRASVSRLFFDSLALSAWKEAGGTRWALRVNPSSGNLHPTEGYLIAGPVPGLSEEPAVYHYAPGEHALELRASLPEVAWRRLASGFPDGTCFVGSTSILWREAWKYGERAYRYCQHDVGHAIAAVAVAAAGLGWEARLLEEPGTAQLAALFGIDQDGVAEREHADCLLALYPAQQDRVPGTAGTAFLPGPEILKWHGTPNRLSSSHVDWGLEPVAEAARKPPTVAPESWGSPFPRLEVEPSPVSLRRIIRQRRSAVAMDGRTGITREAFYQVLRKLLPGPDQVPFTTLPWKPRVHLVFFVHRVGDLLPGLYVLARDPDQVEPLRAALSSEFDWATPEGCPAGMPFFRLVMGDARRVAAQVSCGQDIAADGCFAVAMLAEFEPALQEYGAWFYPRLFWECGVIGQMLYLEAESLGVRGTGIGCYFDDPVHELLGLRDTRYQDLYHFTVGGPVDDPRLSTLPAYPD
jgi:SagB-type dehydrogenase family enzyme